MNELSLGGAKYFLLFKDDFSHYRTIYFLKNKSEAVEKLNNFLKLVNNQFGRQVKTLKSDNGKEIKNTESRKILEELGIFHERSAKYTPEQNGRIEREMRTIVEAARAELHTGNLSKQLWAEAMNYSVFTINRTGTSSVKGKSPAELWFGRHMNIKSMKPFGCKCYILIPNRDRKKLDKKSQKGIFVGYDLEETGYRIYIPDKRKIEISCDVVFDEKLDQNFNSTEIFLDRKTENLQEEKHVSRQEESHDTESSDEESYTSIDEMDEELQIPDRRENESENVPQRALRDRRLLRPPNRYDPCVSNFTALIGDVEEISVEDALNNPQWKRAMDDEMDSLDKTHTWLLTELPEGRKALSNRWVFRIKDDGKMKARLVARGYDQQQGTDYFETFSPVVRHASIRLLLSFAVKDYKHVRTFDIRTAFLNGDLTEDIYMFQPQGYDDGSGKVCKLLKSLYGLKQAPKSWNVKFTSYLKTLNFEATDDDPCLFYNAMRTVIIALFVDDGFIISKNHHDLDQLLNNLSAKFEVTSKSSKCGKLKYVGMEINFFQHGIFVNQPGYTDKILEKFGFNEANEASTPMEPGMMTNETVNDQVLSDKPFVKQWDVYYILALYHDLI